MAVCLLPACLPALQLLPNTSPARPAGRLVAVGVVDVLPRCLSSVYLFWDPGGWRGLRRWLVVLAGHGTVRWGALGAGPGTVLGRWVLQDQHARIPWFQTRGAP